MDSLKVVIKEYYSSLNPFPNSFNYFKSKAQRAFWLLYCSNNKSVPLGLHSEECANELAKGDIYSNIRFINGIIAFVCMCLFCGLILKFVSSVIDGDIVVVIVTLVTSIICAIITYIALNRIAYYLFGDWFYYRKLRKLKEWATCPSCGKFYCIDNTDMETISESIITQAEGSRQNREYVNYRVGIRIIYWQCNECGKSGSGEIKYKERA